MSKIKNISKIELDDVTKQVRIATERRAANLYYFVKEADAAGVSEDIFRNGLFKYGQYLGSNKYAKMKDRSDLRELSKFFGVAPGDKVLEQEKVCISDDVYEIHFNYCPMVAAWQKLGLSDEEIKRMCSIAMENDYGSTSQLDGIDFVLEDTIADGGDCCVIKFVKHKDD